MVKVVRLSPVKFKGALDFGTEGVPMISRVLMHYYFVLKMIGTICHLCVILLSRH